MSSLSNKLYMCGAVRISLMLVIMLLSLSPVEAQRKTTTPKKPVVEETHEEDPRITEMLSAIQHIVFIDSIVVDKEHYMSLIPLSTSIGLLTQDGGLGTFTNEMGDRRLATTKDSSIVACDFIAGEWSEPQAITGIGKDHAINPFLMPDGITLYFAQKGEKSIGGYDIFVTRYDRERNAFLKPENLGMPFASEANDLFFAIDEFHDLGYFVSDRRQPKNKVCVYTFIPQQSRQVYKSENYSDQKLRQLAAISRISDTWGDGKQRKAALDRLGEARTQMVLNLPLDMPSGDMTEIVGMRQQALAMQKALDKARVFYATASESDRQTLRKEILDNEKQLEMLLLEIREKEKQIPYSE